MAHKLLVSDDNYLEHVWTNQFGFASWCLMKSLDLIEISFLLWLDISHCCCLFHQSNTSRTSRRNWGTWCWDHCLQQWTKSWRWKFLVWVSISDVKTGSDLKTTFLTVNSDMTKLMVKRDRNCGTSSWWMIN